MICFIALQKLPRFYSLFDYVCGSFSLSANKLKDCNGRTRTVQLAADSQEIYQVNVPLLSRIMHVNLSIPGNLQQKLRYAEITFRGVLIRFECGGSLSLSPRFFLFFGDCRLSPSRPLPPLLVRSTDAEDASRGLPSPLHRNSTAREIFLN